ncbi:MAG: DUF177 domain-containing protein [Alphaproteobacteria bacterium]|nr:DUF177 domain-containing protein [Alphaproteobacteria bacterium]
MTLSHIQIDPEFSRVVSVFDLTDDPKKFTLSATAEECDALAKRFGLQKIRYLNAECEVWRPEDGNVICLKGKLKCEVVQTCVITFEPVIAKIKDNLLEFFEEKKEDKYGKKDQNEIDLPYLDDEEVPEILESSELDMGEVIAQHLAISLDPYPRAPQAELTKIVESHEEKKISPFECLSEKLSHHEESDLKEGKKG